MMKFSNSCDGQPSTFSTSENCFAQARCRSQTASQGAPQRVQHYLTLNVQGSAGHTRAAQAATTASAPVVLHNAAASL